MVSVVTTAPADLPDSIEELRALVFLQHEKHEAEIAARDTEIAARNTEISARDTEISARDTEISECNEEISHLREYIRLLKSKRFGVSSERTVSEQMGLFNEAEILCDEASDTEETS